MRSEIRTTSVGVCYQRGISLLMWGPMWTVVHEAGHALTGWMLGTPPWAIRIGKGPRRHPEHSGIDGRAWNTPTVKLG